MAPLRADAGVLAESIVLRLYRGCLRGNYDRLTSVSRYFPNLQLPSLVQEYRSIAYQQSSSQAIRQLRRQVSGQ